MDAEESSLIEYPCDFPIKVMGKSQSGFAQVVLSIVKTHAPDFDDAMMEVRLSKRHLLKLNLYHFSDFTHSIR